MSTYDCFTFFNELELLAIHLTELEEIVDIFVILESPLTFQGRQKDLYFRKNQDRFARWLPKIRNLIVYDNPETNDPWERERHQRDCLRRGFADAAEDDWVIISDIDEIPSRDGIRRATANDGLKFIETRLFYQALNLMPASGRTWTASFIGQRRDIEHIKDFTQLRREGCSHLNKGRSRVIPNAGWHFSSIGGVEAIMSKLSAFSENSPDVLAMNNHAFLSRHLEKRTLFFSDEPLISVSVEEGFPNAIRENAQNYLRLGLLTDDYAVAPSLKDTLKTIVTQT